MIGLRFFLCACALAITALLVSQAAPLLARLDLFRIREIRVEGVRTLEAGTVIARAAIPADASLWDDPERWEEVLEAHPMLREARIRRRFPHTFVIEVVERSPVALLATPLLRPVDAEGVILPLDPAERALDLPVIRPPAGRVGAVGQRATAAVRALVAELERLAETSPTFLSTISDLALDEGGNVSARLIDPPIEFSYDPPLDPQRLRVGLLVLRDASARQADSVPVALDLRFADQVVVRYAPVTIASQNGG
ncbi:MAG: FtsQ-type POTRA domain-containing protein [Gemmatimonadetes bacterium]|nr:FtsQ-type POTRA domain-containing protein [Gemmatimonadota bacterium]